MYVSPFPGSDDHLLTLLRYVGRNPLRAKLVKHAHQWRWSGQWERRKGEASMRSLLSPWPIAEPADRDKWLAIAPSTDELKELREHIRRGRPYGSTDWMQKTARKLGLESTLRRRGGYRRKNAPSSK